MRRRRFWCHSDVVGPFALDGYDILAPLGAGGRRWRAICLDDGRPLVLRRWIGAGHRLADVRRQAALWSSAAGDGVVAVRDVVCAGADLVVVSEMGGEPLDLVLARRRALPAGQLVTLVVGLATTLTQVHERGLAHGRLDSSSVVLGDDGRLRLTDYVFGDADPSSDVAALVAMALGFVDSTTPAVLTAALESAVDARGLAESVLSSLPAESLLSGHSVAVPTPAAPGSSAGVRMRAAAVFTVAVAVVATVIGVWWGRQDPAVGAQLPARVSPTPMPSAPTRSLGAVVEALERQRVHALAHADATELAEVEVAHTALWRRDSRTVLRLTNSHLHLQKLRVDVRRIDVLSTSPRRAVVRVIDAMSSYDVVDANGDVVDHQPARPPLRTMLVLAHERGRWKILAVSRRSR